MTLSDALNNYKFLGATKTKALIEKEQSELNQTLHAIGVLETVDKLRDMVREPNFKKYDIGQLLVYMAINKQNDIGVVFEFAHNDGSVYQYEEYETVMPIAQKIMCTIEDIKIDKNLIPVKELNKQKTFDFTLEGLELLQNFLLTPSLAIKVEKNNLLGAVPLQTLKSKNIVPKKNIKI